MDENRFFKEATLLICSSLQIEVALWRLHRFLSQHLPADEIYLNIYESADGVLRFIARADRRAGVKLEKTIKLQPELVNLIESGRRMEDYLLLNDPEQDPIGEVICREFGFAETSLLALRLVIEGQRIGVMDVFAQGKNRFQEPHAHRLRLLREPISIALANALQHGRLLRVKEELLSDYRFLNQELLARSGAEVIGANSGLKTIMESVSQIAPLKTTVLIIGETGVGKEVIANAIHNASPRREQPFIKVNCGAIPENLIDSELFGHEKGAFTGAYEQRRGRFERANRGTIFLDEIGELPPWAQVRLLRVLQTGEIERVGSTTPLCLDIRVICATHRDLQEMVRAGRFREDLWFRINAFPLVIPPLRRRRGDIVELVQYFIGKKAREMGIHQPPQVAPAAMERLLEHRWPGNVRELENTVERSLIRQRTGMVKNIDFSAEQEGAIWSPPEDAGADLHLEAWLRNHILLALSRSQGRISGSSGAAVRLGIHPNTLRSKMAKLGIPFRTKETAAQPFSGQP